MEVGASEEIIILLNRIINDWKKNIQLRLSERKKLNRYDKFKMLFYKKVQLGFIKISNKNKKKYLKINSNLHV